MARLFMANFENGVWDGFDEFATNPAYPLSIVNACQGRALSVTNSYAFVRKNFGDKSEIYIAMLVQTRKVDADLSMLELRNGDTILARLQRVKEHGSLTAWRGHYATELASGVRGLLYDRPALVEVRYKPDEVSGVFQVKINGIMEIDYSGNTSASGSTVNGVIFGNTVGSSSPSFYFDNIIIDDAAWPGDSLVASLLPAGAGNSTQWTPSAGNNYTNVDEAPASDADGVLTNTADQLDLYSLGDLPAEANAVKCVQLDARSFRNGASTPTIIKAGLRTGGTNYLGDSFSPDKMLPVHVTKLYETNPNTASNWSVSEVNGLEAGVQSGA